MNFLGDLREIIASEFANQGISYPEHADVDCLAQRYLEMQVRRVSQRPRKVHFSDEVHDSLGRLVKGTDSELSPRKRESWGTVFYLRHLFEAGASVLPFLSDKIKDSESTDGMLWDYGLHHFHLSRKPGRVGFVKRSDWLLYARVTDEDVYFVDVRGHRDPEHLEWVKQDLLSIIHSNWPELMEPFRMKGVKGDQITDPQKKELRRKNTNLIHEIGGNPIMPLGMGMTADGHSMLCRFLADKLLNEIIFHQSYFDNEPGTLHATLASEGNETSPAKLRLVKLEDLEWTPDQVTHLLASDNLETGLARTGFGVIESATQTLVLVNFQNVQP